MIPELVRTNNNNPDFTALVKKLDSDLWDRYGEMQLEYSPYNIIENNNTVVIAYHNGTPIGCGCFKPFDESSVEIKRMFVDASFRGHGTGGAILNELINWAYELGYKAAVLETAYGQPAAIHLYRKNGFEIIPNYGQYAGKEQSVCMKRTMDD